MNQSGSLTCTILLLALTWTFIAESRAPGASPHTRSALPLASSTTKPTVTNSIGMVFVRIQPGSFIMGSDSPTPLALKGPSHLANGDWDVAHDRVHTEIFGSGNSIMPGVVNAPRRPPHAPSGSPGKGPSISFARAGLSVSWDSRFQSLLELAEACDVPVRWSCRAGVCHTCECGLISGSVQYGPEPLEPPAAGNLLICCSCPLEDVVIDI